MSQETQADNILEISQAYIIKFKDGSSIKIETYPILQKVDKMEKK